MKLLSCITIECLSVFMYVTFVDKYIKQVRVNIVN